MTVTSYELRDIYGNTFLCNHTDEYDTQDPTFIKHRIEVGSSHMSDPCVKISIKEQANSFRVWVDDFYSHPKCSQGENLPRGERGTQSMLLCALQMVEQLYPDCVEFKLQDSSYPKDGSENVSLADIYMLTRGKSWYESFLNVKPLRDDQGTLVRNYKRVVNQIMTTLYNELIRKSFGGKTIYEANIKETWQKCYGKCKWYEFLKELSDNNGNAFLVKHMEGITDMLNVGPLDGVVWKGNLSEQEERLEELRIYSTVKRFGQRGGGRRIRRGITIDEIM